MFFYSAENEVYGYVKKSKAIKVDSEISIKIDRSFSGRAIRKNNIKNIFLPWVEKDFKAFEKEIKPILDKYRESVVVRNNIYPKVIFENKNGGIDLILDIENKFRAFLNLIIADIIPIIESWCSYKEGNEKIQIVPFLDRIFIEKKSRRKQNLHFFKLNKYSFGDGSGSWQQLEPNVRQWFLISKDKEWEPIFSIIK